MTFISLIMLAFNCWLFAKLLATDFRHGYEEIGRDALIVSALNLTVFLFFTAMYSS